MRPVVTALGLQHLGHACRADGEQRGERLGSGHLVEQGDGFVGVVFVVEAAQHDLPTVDAAGHVGRLEGQADAGVEFGGLGRHRPGEGRHLGNDELAGGREHRPRREAETGQ